MRKKDKIFICVVIGITIAIIFFYMIFMNHEYNRKLKTSEDVQLKTNIVENFVNPIISTAKEEINKEPSQWKTENVKITLKEGSITKTSGIIIIEDKNEEPKSWGLNFAIQKSGNNNIWVDMITKETISWIAVSMLPNGDGITEMQLDWSKIYGELNTGKYRIIKYNGLSTLYSESFTIK